MSARDVMHSAESVEWYTPREIVDAARAVMGDIELDPASCAEANRTVRAHRFLTIDDDGLLDDWRAATVWMNPPYGKDGGKSNQARWLHKLCDSYRAGRVEQACALVNAMTGNRWFAPLWQHPLCFISGRVRFVAPTHVGTADQPTHSSVVVYLGPRVDSFRAVFAAAGHVVMPAQVATDSRQAVLL